MTTTWGSPNSSRVTLATTSTPHSAKYRGIPSATGRAYGEKTDTRRAGKAARAATRADDAVANGTSEVPRLAPTFSDHAGPFTRQLTIQP